MSKIAHQSLKSVSSVYNHALVSNQTLVLKSDLGVYKSHTTNGTVVSKIMQVCLISDPSVQNRALVPGFGH